MWIMQRLHSCDLIKVMAVAAIGKAGMFDILSASG
jgi:hypothetical protein